MPRRKTNTEFKKELSNVQGNAIILLEKYKNAHTKIRVKCRHCGLVWKAWPESLLKGSGCPRCNRHLSYGEKYVYHYLCHHLHAHFDCGYIIPDNGLHFDFWIPSQRLAIEYDGSQHFKYSPFFCEHNPYIFEMYVDRDNLKNQYCKYKHIILIRLQNFHKDINYPHLNYAIKFLLSHIQSSYRHHKLYPCIYRFNVNEYIRMLFRYEHLA